MFNSKKNFFEEIRSHLSIIFKSEKRISRLIVLILKSIKVFNFVNFEQSFSFFEFELYLQELRVNLQVFSQLLKQKIKIF